MTDTNKMRDPVREQFEAWVVEDARKRVELKIERDGDWYVGPHALFLNSALRIWQASRQAVVVELPAPAVPGGNCIRDHAIQEAIEAQGLRVGVRK